MNIQLFKSENGLIRERFGIPEANERTLLDFIKKLYFEHDDKMEAVAKIANHDSLTDAEKVYAIFQFARAADKMEEAKDELRKAFIQSVMPNVEPLDEKSAEKLHEEMNCDGDCLNCKEPHAVEIRKMLGM